MLQHAVSLERLEPRLLLTGPTANTDYYSAGLSTTLNIPAYAGVLANDTGGSGPLSAVLISGPSGGSLTLNSNGSFSYTNTSFVMPGDSFTYKAFDGTNYSSPATAYIGVSFTGYQPDAQDQSYFVTHDHTLTVSAASGVLSGDTDPNGVDLTAVLTSGPSHGSVTVNSDGSFTYTPTTHFAGADEFSYKAYDGSYYSSPANVVINVTNASPVANGDEYSLLSGNTLSVSAADGVLSNDSDPDGDTLTASLVSGPSHGSVTLNSDGSFAYTPTSGFLGTDSFVYAATDGIASSDATVLLTTQFSVLSATNETKVPVDTIDVSRQVLSEPFNSPISSPLPAGGSGGTAISAAPADGAPATAHNLSLIYNSVLGQPDQVIEAEIGLSSYNSTSQTITATLTFDGSVQPAQYFTMSSLNGTDSYVLLSQQVDTSSLASGRYAWSLTVTSPNMQAPATVSGDVNVVNDSSSPFGKGWDMSGLYRLFNNSVSGVPSGVLLSTGDGGAWYYTQGTGSSYTSPAGPFAFSTLTSLTGGGWKLVTHEGVTFTFNSSGYLTSREERTGETTSYTWTSGELTAITDQFGRSVSLGYTSGLLSSIEDYAGNSWTIAHSGSDLTSVTEPNPGGGAPEWQYGYSGNYMSSETDPSGNETQFTLNSFHRLSGTTLPDSSTTADTSEQDFGYGSTSSSSPADLTLTSSVVPSTTDADGYTSDYQTDQFGNVTSDTDPYGHTTTIMRDANGLPTQFTLPPPTTGASSPVTNIYYDSTGDETYATGAQPTYGTYTYTSDSFGRWATFTDSLGKEWTRTFDTSGNILTETDQSGNQVSWTYSSYGQPLTMTVPAPNNASGTQTTHYYYDSDDRLDEIVWPDSTTEHFGYNSNNYRTTYEDEDGNTTTTAYDVLNRVTSVTDAASGVTSTTYDADGNVLTTTDSLGNVTSYEYNSMNELVQETLQAPTTGGTSPVLSWTYDPNGNKLTSTDAMGRETSYTYDELSRLIEETLPAPSTGAAAPTIEYAYDNLGHQVTETDALGGVTTTLYGNTDISQVTSVEEPPPSGSGTGPTTTYGYDGDGRQNTVTDAMSHTTTTTFTIDGETASVEDNLGNTTTYTYGNGGELLTTTDPLSHATTKEYDSRYRLIQTTDANSGVTAITLDGVGNETALTDPDGNETQWTYDSLNRAVTETNSLGTTTTTYDADSDVTAIEDADGRVRDFTYDNLQRLTAEQWMSGSTVVATMSYAYDADNELTSTSDQNSAYAYTYNADGQAISTDNAGTPNVPDVVLSGGYNVGGEMTSRSASIAGTADLLDNYSYNDDGLVTMVQQEQQLGGNTVAPKEIDYTYNALGQLTSTAAYNTLSGPRADVLTGAYTYDSDNRLTGLAYTSDGGANTIDTFGWNHNDAGLVTSFSSNDGTASYLYDDINQLTTATYTTSSGGHQPTNESYSFDSNGNRNSTGYTTGADNLMSSDGTYDYTYDADGNVITRTQISSSYSTDYKTAYTWDYRNRLTDVEDYDNNGVLREHIHYVYDVFNSLIGEEVDDTGSGSYDSEQWYVVAGGQPVLQFNGSGDLTQRNLVAPNPAGVDAVMAQEAVSSLTAPGAVTWMAADNMGTPRDVINNSGTVVNHVVYNSFGEVTYESDPSYTDWAGFGGGHEDMLTDLVLNGRRWYDPSAGRWLSQDPIGFQGRDADLSRYVGNDPTNANDPSGLLFGLGWPSGADYAFYLTNPSAMDPALQGPQYFALGVTVGALGGVGVVVAAPLAVSGIAATGLMTTAAAQTAVTGTIVVGSGIGLGLTALNTVQAYNAGNWNQIYFNVGTVIGAFGGARIGQMVNGRLGTTVLPTPGATRPGTAFPPDHVFYDEPALNPPGYTGPPLNFDPPPAPPVDAFGPDSLFSPNAPEMPGNNPANFAATGELPPAPGPIEMPGPATGPIEMPGPAPGTIESTGPIEMPGDPGSTGSLP